MAARPSVDHDIAGWLRQRLEEASPDLLREMVQTFAEALMGAEAEALCNAGYRERSPERTNSRNGYRGRDWDTRVGTIELAVPKLRSGSYFPDWLLQRRRRSEAALISVVATSYLLGVSTRRMEKLVETFGIASLVEVTGIADGHRPRRRRRPRSAAGRWTPARTRSAGPTRWRSRSARAGG